MVAASLSNTVFYSHLTSNDEPRQNTPIASLKRGLDPPLQYPEYENELHLSWSSGECRTPLHCHYSQVHSDPEENCPVDCGCRIHQLHHSRGIRPPNECPGYDTKQSDGKVPVMLEFWGIWSTPSLPVLPGTLWPRVVAIDKGPIYGLNRTKPWFLEFTGFCI